MRAEIKEKLDYLRKYEGRRLRIMEICGSHTAAISRSGLRSLISERIELISGPGCPVCVTPAAYIDRLIELSFEEKTEVAVFGDMLRVPGSSESLSAAKGRGGRVTMLYSPLELINLAKANPDKTFVFSAVGFETTTPAYALLLSDMIDEGIKNIRLLTALKTMPPAVSMLIESSGDIDGFFAPGHVCAVTGYRAYEELAEKYSCGFCVAGFEAEELIMALSALTRMLDEGRYGVENHYRRAVSRDGNERAAELVYKYFETSDAVWRGTGSIKGSGLKLREEYADFDAGSSGLEADVKQNTACRCGEVLSGRCTPFDCPLFLKKCTPEDPQGACMVSEEGACRARMQEALLTG